MRVNETLYSASFSIFKSEIFSFVFMLYLTCFCAQKTVLSIKNEFLF